MGGEPAAAIAALATAGRFSLLAVGSRGQRGPTRQPLGSVSGRLAHLCAKLILLIVR